MLSRNAAALNRPVDVTLGYNADLHASSAIRVGPSDACVFRGSNRRGLGLTRAAKHALHNPSGFLALLRLAQLAGGPQGEGVVQASEARSNEGPVRRALHSPGEAMLPGPTGSAAERGGGAPQG